MASIGNRLPVGSTLENGFYLGFPLLILLGYLVIRCRRVPLVATAAVVGVVAFILGLGPRLTVDGKAVGIPLPFAIFRHLPIVQNLEAARFSLYVQLAAAIIFALGLDQVRAHGWLPARARAAAGQPAPGGASGTGTAWQPRPWERPAVAAVVGLAVLAPLLPNLPLPTANMNTPGYFTGKQVAELPAGALALTLPFDKAPQNDPMMWQVASGMRFRILGGDAFVPKSNGQSTWHWRPSGPKVLAAILKSSRYSHAPLPPMGGNAVSAVRQLISSYPISVVLVDRTPRTGGPSPCWSPARCRPRRCGGGAWMCG